MAKQSTSDKGNGDPTATATEEKKFRYTDDDLREFEELINAKLETLRTELKESQEIVLADLEVWESTAVSNTRIRISNNISELESALLRIKTKTYGICSVTRELIPKNRLKAHLTATTTVGQALELAKKNVPPVEVGKVVVNPEED